MPSYLLPKSSLFQAFRSHRSPLSECLEQANPRDLGTRLHVVVIVATLPLLKLMTHGTIRDDDFERNRVLQHSCDIVLNCHNIVPTLLPTKSSLQIVLRNISLNLLVANNYKPILSFKSKHCSVTKPKHGMFSCRLSI